MFVQAGVRRTDSRSEESEEELSEGDLVQVTYLRTVQMAALVM